jgi:ring-1,2-phenylacetyl-CoA epoxidase subunit PaaD
MVGMILAEKDRKSAGVADERSRELRERAVAALTAVVDPEIPVLTIADLGILRGVLIHADDAVEAVITPTYSGCPAMNMIALEADLALEKAGFARRKITTVLSPAWSTDFMSAEGREKLRAYGIAPPPAASSRAALMGEEAPSCPRCASREVERISEFGSTACKALWRCTACREPFDYFKCI